MAQEPFVTIYIWDFWQENDKLYIIAEIGNELEFWEKIILE